MSSQMYEVEVLVKDNPDKIKGHYSSFHALYRNWEERKMKHIEATSQDKAVEKAKKYGRVLSVRKHDSTRRYEQIEHIDYQSTQPDKILDKDAIYALGNPRNNPLSMDEMIWQKRNSRRKNMIKDKQNY